MSTYVTRPAAAAAGLVLLVPIFLGIEIGSNNAQPVAERILDKVEVTEQAGCSTVSVHFNFPVRYVSHFPRASGRELCVRIRPLAVGSTERSFSFQRESLRSPLNERAAISRIAYEGDAVSGPCLSLYFKQPVYFIIGQGEDFRSIDIAIAGPQPDALCRPARGVR